MMGCLREQRAWLPPAAENLGHNPEGDTHGHWTKDVIDKDLEVAMAVVAFDTLKMARALREQAKLAPEQAEGITNAMADAMSGSDLATKADLGLVESSLKAEIAAVEARLRAEIAAVEASLKAEIAAVEASLKAEIAAVEASLKAEIAAVENRLDRRIGEFKADILKSMSVLVLGGLTVNIITVLGAMLGLVKLLGH